MPSLSYLFVTQRAEDGSVSSPYAWPPMEDASRRARGGETHCSACGSDCSACSLAMPVAVAEKASFLPSGEMALSLLHSNLERMTSSCGSAVPLFASVNL